MILHRVAVALAMAIGVVIATATPAAAHASLQETDPVSDGVVEEAPSRVELRFDDAVDGTLGGLTVTGPDGARVDDGVTRSSESDRVVTTEVDADARGSYLVEWSVVSDDGHLLEGSFVFSVGETSDVAAAEDDGRTVVRALAGTARAAAYAGTLLLVGVLAVGVRWRRREEQQLARAAIAGALLVLVASLFLLLAQTALAAGRPLSAAVGLLGATIDTRTGSLTADRAAIAGAVLVLAGLWLRTGHRAALAAVGIATGALCLVPAIAGHAWTSSARLVAVLNDAVHLASAGVWVGGLFVAAIVLRDSGLRERLIRFSAMATGALLLTVVTGAISGWFQTGSIPAVTDTGYGQLLIVKVGLVVVVAAAGWFNRQLLSVDFPHRRMVVVGELAAAVLVLAVTAAIVNQPPARETIAQPVYARAVTTGEVSGSIEVQIDPARAGANDLHVYFFDDRGRPRRVDVAEVLVARPGEPARRVDVTPVTPEHVSAYGMVFPSAGTWVLTVTSLAAGQASSATLEVEIR